MAAHILTVLKEISERPMSLEMIQHGLGYSLSGDQLSTEDWSSLAMNDNLESVRIIAMGLIPKYQAIWEYLGQPATAEKWNATWFAMQGAERQHYWDLVFGKVQS